MSVVQGGSFPPPESQPGRSLPGAADVACSPVATPPHGFASASRPSPAGTGAETLGPRARSMPQSSRETLCLANRHAKPSLHHSGAAFCPQLQVVLGDHSLWLQFHRRQNEMILTKPGRAMFPLLAYTIHGMDPNARYHVFVDLVPTDPHRWRYEKQKWVRYAKEDNQETASQVYIHPHSPNTGAHWMKQEISFKKLRLTNSQTTAKNAAQAILLTSLHRYQPRLHIQELGHGKQQPLAASSAFSHIFTFPETEFIAVTAYHNAEITRLKVNHNPFASAFRKGSQSVKGFHEGPPGAAASANPSPEALSLDSSYPLGAKEVTAQNQGESSATPCCSIRGPQPPWQQTEDSSPGGMLAFQLGARNAGFLPCTSPPVPPAHPGQSAVLSLGRALSSLPESPPGHCRESLPSQPPKPTKSFSAAREEGSLQEQIWTYVGPSDGNSSVGVGEERPAEKTRLSPPDSGGDAMCSVSEVGDQQDYRLAAGEASASTCPVAAAEDSSSLAGLEEGTAQDKEKGDPIPWDAFPGPQPPWQRVYDAGAGSNSTPGTMLPFALEVENPGFLPCICPPAMPGAVDSRGQGPPALPQTSQGQWMDSLLSLPPKLTDSVPGAQEGESLQEQIWTCVGQSDWNSCVGVVPERPAKETCFSPPDSGRDAMCSVREVRDQQDYGLALVEARANTRPEAASEDSSYPAGLKEATGQGKEKGDPIPRYDIQGPQPPSQHPCDSTLSSCSAASHHPSSVLPFEQDAMIPGLLPSASLLALLSHPTQDPLLSLWERPPSLSGIAEGNHMGSLQSLSPKLMDPITGAQEEERHQEESFASRAQSEADDSAAGPKAPKKRRLSANDFSGQDSSFSSLECLSEFLF